MMTRCLPTWVFIACIFFTGAFTPVVADADSDFDVEDFAEGFAGDGGDGNIVNNDVSSDNNSGGEGNKNIGFNIEAFADKTGDKAEGKSNKLGWFSEDFANGSGRKAEWGSNGLGMYAEDGATQLGRKTEYKADNVEDKSDKIDNKTETFADGFAIGFELQY